MEHDAFVMACHGWHICALTSFFFDVYDTAIKEIRTHLSDVPNRGRSSDSESKVKIVAMPLFLVASLLLVAWHLLLIASCYY